jgi:hypothetical protein
MLLSKTKEDKMSKLNKTQTADLITELVQTTVAEYADLFKKDKDTVFSDILTARLFDAVGPKMGGGVIDKIDADGNVYCNYFQAYLPEEEFNRKTNGKFKANCIRAEQILRKVKRIKNSETRGITSQFRAGKVTEEEWGETMNKLDAFAAKHYDTVEDVKYEG